MAMLCLRVLSAQVKIGTDTISPNANAILELQSTGKGLLFSRLNTTQMNTMASPPNGMVIYNTDSNSLVMRSEGVWKKLLGGFASTIQENTGVIMVHQYCNLGDGTVSNPWRSSDGSAGIKPALKQLTPTRRTLYFRAGYYHTSGAQTIDFSVELPNLTNADWKAAFQREGVEFLGTNAKIIVNGGTQLTGGQPGILFRWPNTDIFYWKFKGLGFYGNVNSATVQWGINENDFPLNSVDFDITCNNGYVPANYTTVTSPSSAVTIYRPLDCRMHLVAVSATGVGAYLGQAVFCTISGAFSNTNIPASNNVYPNSYALKLVNCMANNFTHVDLEVAYNGIKFDLWSIQNTFSAIWVGNCDKNGYVFDNSGTSFPGLYNGQQAKNLVLSMRNGPTLNGGATNLQGIYTPSSFTAGFSLLNSVSF